MAAEILTRPAPAADHRLAYGEDPNQFGDLRLPAGRGPHPLVVYLHGGFWRAAYSLEHAGHACAALTALGFATWNVEYRRVGQPGGGWPRTFQDVAAGADYARALAERFPLDILRTLAMGHSAGGQLALWLAARHRLASSGPLHTARPLGLVGAVSLAGVVDLVRAAELELGSHAVAQLLGGTPQLVPDRYASTSPFELLPLSTPQVLLHGTADDRVPYEISQRYADAARAAGDPVELVTLPGAGHFEVIDPRSHVWPEVLAAAQRLARHQLEAQ